MLAQIKPNQNKDKADIAPWNITGLDFITIKKLSSGFSPPFFLGGGEGGKQGTEAKLEQELLRNRTAKIQ